MLSYGKQHKRLGGLSHLVYTGRMEAFLSYKELSFPKKGQKLDFFREPDV